MYACRRTRRVLNHTVVITDRDQVPVLFTCDQLIVLFTWDQKVIPQAGLQDTNPAVQLVDLGISTNKASIPVKMPEVSYQQYSHMPEVSFQQTVTCSLQAMYPPDADTRHGMLHFHVTIKLSAPTSVFCICLTDLKALYRFNVC